MVTMLDEVIFRASIRELAVRDSDLARVVETYGAPPLWVREPGFPSLVYIILEQQVSLASARAAFQRLRAVVSPLTPPRFLKLSDEQLSRLAAAIKISILTSDRGVAGQEASGSE